MIAEADEDFDDGDGEGGAGAGAAGEWGEVVRVCVCFSPILRFDNFSFVLISFSRVSFGIVSRTGWGIDR